MKEVGLIEEGASKGSDGSACLFGSLRFSREQVVKISSSRCRRGGGEEMMSRDVRTYQVNLKALRLRWTQRVPRAHETILIVEVVVVLEDTKLEKKFCNGAF